MESCGGAHWLARQIGALGHEVKLIAPQYVKPFVKGNKSDFINAEAICEAASRPAMHFCSIKTAEQQTLLALQPSHRRDQPDSWLSAGVRDQPAYWRHCVAPRASAAGRSTTPGSIASEGRGDAPPSSNSTAE